MPENNLYFDSPVLSTASFDPNAGKQAAYNTRWNNYLTNLGETQNKINVKKARKYFDSQFELDWNNEAASREVDFTLNQAKQNQNDLISRFRAANEEAARLSLELDALDYKAAGYTYDAATGKWNKPLLSTSPKKVVPPTLDIPVIPSTTQETLTTSEVPLRRPKESTSSFLNINWNNVDTWGNPVMPPISAPLPTLPNLVFKGDDNYYNKGTLMHAIRKSWLEYQLGLGKSVDLNNVSNINNNKYYNNDFNRYYENALNQYEDRRANGFEGLFRNRYVKRNQQGGTMNNQEELQKAFMAYLIQDAAAQGIQLQSEQDLQAYAQLLGEEGIQAKYQEFMQKMQGGIKARLGAKLEYYRKLKGVCPDGQTPTYFKEGGKMKKVCTACLKGKKMNAVLEFKNKRKLVNPNDTVNTSRGPRDLNGKTKYPKWNANKENYSLEERKRVAEKDERSGKKVFGSACGSKLKKKK